MWGLFEFLVAFVTLICYAKGMTKEAKPSYLSTIDSPIVPIGKVYGQELYIKVEGHDAAEREYHFMKVKKLLQNAFNMPPDIRPVRSFDPAETEVRHA